MSKENMSYEVVTKNNEVILIEPKEDIQEQSKERLAKLNEAIKAGKEKKC